MRSFLRSTMVLLPILFLSVGIGLAETEQPTTVVPPIRDLAAGRVSDSDDVRITWSGGVPPYLVVYAESPEFRDGTKLTFVSVDGPARQYFHAGAAAGKRHHYYRVYSQKSSPRLFSVTPAVQKPGDIVTLRGVGLGRRCDDNRIVLYPNIKARIIGPCDAMTFRFEMPRVAGSGVIMVFTPNGMCEIGGREDWGTCFEHADSVTW